VKSNEISYGFHPHLRSGGGSFEIFGDVEVIEGEGVKA